MKRAAVFAHYDKDNIVDDYVIYYLRALKEIADELVFVSCNELSENEKSKLDGIADFVIAEKHDEYDFGSYKRGFVYLTSRLNDFDGLIFANDSCYGPLYSLRQIFEEMEKDSRCDFWGITKNRFGAIKNKNSKYVSAIRPHIQSYFLVFNKNVFTSVVFSNFIKSIRHLDNKSEIIINYEIGLSELLRQEGFIDASFINSFLRLNHVVISLWRLLIQHSKMPFVKCSILRLTNQDYTYTEKWQEVISKNSDYPIALIEKNLERTLVNEDKLKNIPYWVKAFYFNSISFLPAKLKVFCIKCHRKILNL